MNIDEFKALKQKVHDRASYALDLRGVLINGNAILTVALGPVQITHIFDTFRVRIRLPNVQTPVTVYEITRNCEAQLGWCHHELVDLYRKTLKVIEQHLVLEDLAKV